MRLTNPIIISILYLTLSNVTNSQNVLGEYCVQNNYILQPGIGEDEVELYHVLSSDRDTLIEFKRWTLNGRCSSCHAYKQQINKGQLNTWFRKKQWLVFMVDYNFVLCSKGVVISIKNKGMEGDRLGTLIDQILDSPNGKWSIRPVRGN